MNPPSHPRCRRAVAAALATLPCAFAAPSARAVAVGCDAVIAAMAKGATTPSHQTVTLSGGPRRTPTQGEVVVVDGRMYVQANGHWHARPFDAAARAAEMRQQYEAPEVRARCAPGGSESLGGEATTVWTVHTENDGSVSDGRLWVSNARGLPLRLVIDLQDTKSRSESVWNYADVRAPAGVN